MPFAPEPRRLRLLGAALFIACGAIVAVWINGCATSWIEGAGFRSLLDRETSKGLKLDAQYGALQRVGLFGMQTDSFSGTQGYKTIVTLDAQGITGSFNPLGIYLRRWQIDDVHIRSGSVMLQKSEPTPGAPKTAPWPPWWSIFWPYRVYLENVKIDDANILWKLQEKESGIYHTFLEITPNGRDFEYDARGGDFKTPMTPTLQMEHAHLLVRKPRLYCSEFILGDDPAHPEEQISLKGDAGLQDDHSMHLQMLVASLDVAPLLPAKMRPHVSGHANGNFDYTSTGTGLETGQGSGHFEIDDGVLTDLPPIHEYVTVTGSPDPGPMKLKVCRTDVKWEAGAASAENLEVESEGVFRLTGTITLAADKSLGGQLELGLTHPYLKWLPTAETTIFTRTEGSYHFATIHLSGTAQKPGQDLSPRIIHEIAKSPLLALKLFFNSAANWFDSD